MPRRKWQIPKGLGFPAVIETVTTNGVLTPLLWLCGLLIVATIALAWMNSPIMWPFMFMSGIAGFWVLRSFDFFRLHNPTLLQSESFQLAHQKQQAMIDAEIAGRTIDYEQTSNPMTQLPHTGGING